MQGVYGWLVDEPCPTDSWRTQPRVRTCLGADAVASRCRCGCISVQMRLHLIPDAVASAPACADNHYPSFFPPPPNLPTFKRSDYKTEGRDNKKGTCHFVTMTRPPLFIQLFNQNSYYVSYISCKPNPSSEVFSSSDSEVDTSGRCPLPDSDRCYI